MTNPTQPGESTGVTGEPQNCSEALLLLRLQDYANTLARAQQSLEATCTSLQRTELLSVAALIACAFVWKPPRPA